MMQYLVQRDGWLMEECNQMNLGMEFEAREKKRLRALDSG